MDELDEVERGYYVYVHKDKRTGTPFYVGKGKGDRATREDRRNPGWVEKVRSLPEGHEVEIAEDDLSEEEAYNLERELIRKYGKVSDGTGPLVNRTDGGWLDGAEGPLEIGIQLPPEMAEALREDYENRPCRKLTKSERADLCKLLSDQTAGLIDRFEEAVEDAETDFELAVDGGVWQIHQAADKLSRRKMSIRDFAFELEDTLEDLADCLEEVEVKKERKACVAIARELLALLQDKVAFMRNT